MVAKLECLKRLTVWSVFSATELVYNSCFRRTRYICVLFIHISLIHDYDQDVFGRPREKCCGIIKCEVWNMEIASMRSETTVCAENTSTYGGSQGIFIVTVLVK